MQVSNLPACCTDLDVDVLALLFPERFTPEGLEFVNAHGLDTVTLATLRASMKYIANGKVKIKHRCQHLQDDGRCDIYATRPAVCRAFDCRTRSDCACKGKGYC